VQEEIEGEREKEVHHFNKTRRKVRGKIALRRHKGQIRRDTENENERQEAYFVPYSRPRHECENQGVGDVSYSRITFAALLELCRGERDPSAPFSAFVGGSVSEFSPFKAYIFGMPTSRTIPLFIALCNDTGALAFPIPAFPQLRTQRRSESPFLVNGAVKERKF